MKSKIAPSSNVADQWPAKPHDAVVDPRAIDGWFSAATNLAVKFGRDALMPASTTCAVIYYNRTEWPLLLFVFSVNCAFLAYRFISRKSFGQ